MKLEATAITSRLVALRLDGAAWLGFFASTSAPTEVVVLFLIFVKLLVLDLFCNIEIHVWNVLVLDLFCVAVVQLFLWKLFFRLHFSVCFRLFDWLCHWMLD